MSTMSAAPPEGKSGQMKTCWSCRLISGGGLLLSAVYVFLPARRVVTRAAPVTLGSVLQISFAAGLAACGAFVILDPRRNTKVN